MKKTLSLVLSLLLVLAFAFSLVSCGGSSNSSNNSDENNTPDASSGGPADNSTPDDPSPNGDTETYRELRIGAASANQYVCSFDCYGYNTTMQTGASPSSYLLWDHLFYSDENGSVKTDVLSDYYWSDDNLILTCVLKPGIYFSNGEEMDGYDILWSIQQNKQSPSFLASRWALFDVENSTVSEDGYTVNIVCSEIYGNAMSFLSQLVILNYDWFEELGGDWSQIDIYDPTLVVGSGPYVCTDYVDGTSAVYELRDDYWGFDQGVTWPVYDKIYGYTYSDQTALDIDLETGVLDIAINLSLSDYDRLAAGLVDGVTAYGVDSNSVVFLVLSDENQFTADPAVREAICYAINTTDLTEAVVGSLGITATCLIAPNEAGYEPGLAYDFDPDHAKQVLADAGYQEGDIQLNFAYQSSNPTMQNTAEVVQFYLSQIGINVTMVPYDTAAWYSTMGIADFTDIYWYSLSNGDPDGNPGRYMGYWFDGSLPYFDRNGLYSDVLGKASSVHEFDEMAPYYNDFVKMVNANFDAVPLYQYLTSVGYNTETVAANPFGVAGMLPSTIRPAN